jgi:hypothetical protein
MIPPCIRPFFWDTNPESFDPTAYPAYNRVFHETVSAFL